ncbi:MAG: hypothetical protein EHM39_11540 [Chloroflexi bacterium]|nr:MAG: hypothetical protein EHM39_11540 [Chloroflexota bacterium]
MKPSDVHPLFGETSQAYGPFFGPYRQKIAESGLEPPEWGTLAVAHDYMPDPVSVARLQVRTPYANAQRLGERLASLADRGLLERVGADGYRFTEEGERLFRSLEEGLVESMRALEPLSPADLGRTAALLRHLIDAITVLPLAERSCFTVNRSSDLGPQAPVMLRILQYLADFNAFRDDAHLRAWRSHGVSGPAWEALTLMWRNEAYTPAELAEKLAIRQHTADDYAAALDELAGKGWVMERDGEVEVTDAGRTIRQDAEDLTDTYYFAPWSALSPADIDAMGQSLIALRDRLIAMQPAAETQG